MSPHAVPGRRGLRLRGSAGPARGGLRRAGGSRSRPRRSRRGCDGDGRVVTLRKEVREGRSFNPDEFAIALEQVVSGGAPEDYRDPVQFLARTCFTRALREHTRLVLRRLAGQTEGTAPVMALITQFGGGKTHTLTTLYHLARSPGTLADQPAVRDLLAAASLSALPRPRVAVFVGNAWDPGEGRETPWVDVARQLAGDAGV